jgi:serine/threonine-protein kinase
MRFVNGGMVTFAERSVTQLKRTVKINPFYMDETQVTNHQYVEFLNQNLSQIRVERLVVRGDDEIWLLTGEVIEGYNPIIYKNGRFRVSNAAYAPYPVLRVTGFGALAYANFYKRRLPTVTEWLYVIEKGAMPQSDSSETASGAADETSKRRIMDRRAGSEIKSDRIAIQQDSSSVSQPQELEPLQKLEPVSSIQPNAIGIRGMNKDVGEWALFRIGATSRDDKSEDEYVILGGIEGLPEKDRSMPSLVIRHPWESFEEVGFRCVRSVLLKSAKQE